MLKYRPFQRKSVIQNSLWRMHAGGFFVVVVVFFFVLLLNAKPQMQKSGWNFFKTKSLDDSELVFVHLVYLLKPNLLTRSTGMSSRRHIQPGIRHWVSTHFNHWCTVGFGTSFFLCLGHSFHICEMGGETVGDFDSISTFQRVGTKQCRSIIPWGDDFRNHRPKRK